MRVMQKKTKIIAQEVDGIDFIGTTGKTHVIFVELFLCVLWESCSVVDLSRGKRVSCFVLFFGRGLVCRGGSSRTEMYDVGDVFFVPLEPWELSIFAWCNCCLGCMTAVGSFPLYC